MNMPNIHQLENKKHSIAIFGRFLQEDTKN